MQIYDYLKINLQLLPARKKYCNFGLIILMRMKKLLFYLAALMSLVGHLYAQAPKGFRYQAVIRDASGLPVPDRLIGMRISILASSESGPVVYCEEQQNTTNSFGIVSLSVGKGTPVIGALDTISWGGSKHFLKVDVDLDGTGNWKEAGISEILSVPYALYAEQGANKPKVEIKGTLNYPSDSALFEVKDRNGNTVFAVYEDGVQVIVNEEGKGGRGGFAVGGRRAGKGTMVEDIFKVTPDSVGIYLSSGSGKGGRGGFAVGGRGAGKGLPEEYLRITRDSTRVFTADPVNGFAVGNIGTNPQKYMKLTPENYAIGHRAGLKLKEGLYNSFMGYEAGTNTGAGNSNIFLGYQAGYSNATGSYNVFIGNLAGYRNTGSESDPYAGSYNIFIGHSSGLNNTTGSVNCFIGRSSGYNNTIGSANIFVGEYAGYFNENGYRNVFVGKESGWNNTSGSDNTFLGFNSGWNNSTGQQNTFLGASSGYQLTAGRGNTFLGYNSGSGATLGNYNVCVGGYSGYGNIGSNNVLLGYGAGQSSTGNGNIFIGYNAGSYETGSNKLYIANSNTSKPLIYGDFGALFPFVVINGNGADRTNDSVVFFVNGKSAGLFNWSALSDYRLKESVQTIGHALETVMHLRGVEFQWIDKSKFDHKRHIGFIAQEVEPYLPEVVNKSSNGMYSLDYPSMTAILLEAIKQQQYQIEELRQQVSEYRELKAELDALKQELKKK